MAAATAEGAAVRWSRGGLVEVRARQRKWNRDRGAERSRGFARFFFLFGRGSELERD